MKLRALFCLLAACDLSVTWAMLAGGWHEANPLAVRLLTASGAPALAALKVATSALALALVEAIRRLAPDLERWCLCGLCAIEAGVVAWNLWNLAHLILP